jgi:ribonuclease HI
MTAANNKGIVFYCDGSAAPTNPGPIGWGVHGYLYEVLDGNKPVVVEKHMVTDIGYLAVDPQGNYQDHTLVKPVMYFDLVGSSLDYGSNNKAEIKAFTSACLKAAMYDVGHVYILSDSEYVVNGITKWHQQWLRNNWRKHDGQPVPNKELWIEALNAFNALKTLSIKVKIQWVKAHVDILGNVQADVLAGIGSAHAGNGVILNDFVTSDATHYWQYEIIKNPLLNHKRIYFNSSPKFNVPGQYFQADPGGSDFIIGKKIPDAGFSVVKLVEPDEAIETVKRRMFESPKEFNVIAMIKLDRLYDRRVYKYVAKYGRHALVVEKRNLNLNFIDRKPVCIEVNPTGLSLRSVDAFGMLEEMLADFCVSRKNLTTPTGFKTLDITDEFFTTEMKGHKPSTTLNASITMNMSELMLVKVLDTSYQPVKIPLVLGLDILPRNNLKKLEKHNPSVHLVTWKDSPVSVRYGVIIDSELGIGIYSNFYADKLYLTDRDHDESSFDYTDRD